MNTVRARLRGVGGMIGVAGCIVSLLTAPAWATPGEISFDAPTSEIGEDGGTAEFTVERTGGDSGDVTARVTLNDFTTTPDDYLLHSAGKLDTDFALDPDDDVHVVALQPDGKILVGGRFTEIGGVAREGIARLHPDGTLDSTFTPNITGLQVRDIIVDPDGKILIGGYILSTSTGNHVARLHEDGSLDVTFDSGAGAFGMVSSLALQPDGKVLIGGVFTEVDGVPRNRVARLNVDGSLDTSFDPGDGANDGVYDVSLQADGSVLLAGGFTEFDNEPRNLLARLDENGALDPSFTPELDYLINDGAVVVEELPNGHVLAGGNLTELGSTGGAARRHLMRFDNNGDEDSSFDPEVVGGYVSDFELTVDGRIVVAGSFSTVGNVAINGIARLFENGSLDASFDPGDGVVGFEHALAIQPDGKIVLGGSFDEFDGHARENLARLDAGLLTWADGDASSRTVELLIIDNSEPEPDRELELVLSIESGSATLGQYPSHVLTILDDDQVPYVLEVTSPQENGTYGEGSVIDIEVVFSNRVDVSGTPSLDLNSGGVAYFETLEQGRILVMRYDVEEEDESSHLDYLATGSLSLNGGSIDGVYYTAELTLPQPGSPASLAGTKQIAIEGEQEGFEPHPGPSTAGTGSGGCVAGAAAYADSLLASLLVGLAALLLLVLLRRTHA